MLLFNIQFINTKLNSRRLWALAILTSLSTSSLAAAAAAETPATEGYRRYVLTGGPGVGKTTVVRELARRGYQVSPEAYTSLYEQAAARGGDAIAQLFADPAQFRQALMAKQVALETSLAPDQVGFLDRSTVDITAFGDYFRTPMADELRKQAKSDYDLVFFLDPLPAHFYESTAIRRETPAESAEIHNSLKKAYQDLKYKPYQLVDVPFGTPAERGQFIVDHLKKTFFYADIVDCFAGKNHLYPVQDFIGPVKLIEFTNPAGETYRFFGVNQEQQTRVPFAEFKAAVAAKMGVATRHMLEIVGDSGQFSEAGSNYVRKVLREAFAGNHLIEYGFTGYIKGKELDINSFVNEYVAENPDQAYKVLANILGHTHVALNEWGTRGAAQVRNFVVVYSADGMTRKPAYDATGKKTSGFTTFGDDIIISDQVLNARDGDRMICVEGGVQSFRQAMQALELDVPVDFIYNVRVPAKEKFFSATRFLNLVRAAFTDDAAPSPAQVQKIYDDYRATLDFIWDNSKPDYLTKKALFDTAIQDFINRGIYHKLPTLARFYDAKATGAEARL